VIVLDTSVMIPFRDGDPAIETRVAQLQDEIVISMMTRIELENGIYRDPAFAAMRRTLVDRILAYFPVLIFTDAHAAEYGRVLQQIGYSRRKVFDRMIGVQALTHNAKLITLNPADFTEIPGLQVEAW
jgi:tRNA(fMet)-specific endonuclease VapC